MKNSDKNQDIEWLKRRLDDVEADFTRTKNELELLRKTYDELKTNTEKQSLIYQQINEQYSRHIHKNHARFTAIISNMHTALLVEDADRKILLTNQLFCDLFNITASPDQLVGFDCSSSAQQSKVMFMDEEEFVRDIDTLLINRQPVYGQVLFMKNGKILERDYVPIFDGSDYEGHFWQYRDVTDERELRNELEKIARFPDENPNPVMRFSGDGKLLYSNKVGTQLIEVLNEFKPDSLKQLITDTLQHKEITAVELQVGSTIYQVNKVYIPEKNYINLYFSDITEKYLYQHKLAEQQKFYETILNKIPTDIAVFDAHHRYVFVNPVAIKDDEIRKWIIGKDDFEYCKYRDKPLLIAQTRREKFNQAVASKNGTSWEDELLTPNGKEYVFRRMFPVFDEQGNLQIVIGFGIDITKIKIAELKADESRKSKEIFLANMSHEIRTPINGVLGLANMLQKTRLSTQQQNFISLLKRSAESLLVIINDILDLAKIESGKFDIEKIPFNLHEVCLQVIQTLAFKAEEKQLQLIYSPNNIDDLNLLGDPYRLNQILINLLNNAIKFTHTGKVVLNVTSSQINAQLVSVQFSVVDTGIGIESEKLDGIFEEFNQANETISRKFGGTGLGLSICKKLISLQGGKIWVDSELNKGTTFYVLLEYPITALRVKPDVQEIYKNVNALKGKRVLIAEDNEVNMFIAKSLLLEWGMEVEEAVNGLIALEKYNQLSFDIVIMDMQMPEMDGASATKAIRKIEESSKLHVPIIALTANAIKGEKEKYLAIGADDYLSKPFDENDLFEKIASLLKLSTHSLHDLAQPLNFDKTYPLYSTTLIDRIDKDNKDFLLSMMRMVVTTLPQITDQIFSAVEEQNYEQVNRLMHKLKATVQTLQIHKAVELIERIQHDIENQQLENIKDMAIRLVYFLQTVTQAIRQDFDIR
ncbi:MAG: ATP-binding protein [Bacteroidia bacterium]|jgi:signal transduction histidine kinase/CheY-like chemotaxis protein|nr:ATP-binding protein [Bacteroidia bacterium]